MITAHREDLLNQIETKIPNLDQKNQYPAGRVIVVKTNYILGLHSN
jgi:hypothetical protein